MQLREDPPSEDDVGEVDHVVAVHMRDEQRGERVRGCTRLGQPQHRRPPGVELERDVAVPHERARSRSPGRGQRDARSGEGDGGGRETHACCPTVQPCGASTSSAIMRGVSSNVVAMVSFHRFRYPNNAHTATIAVICSSE